MSFMDALNYPYSSRDLFSKLLLAFIFAFVPIISLFGGFVLMGYGVRIIYHVSQGDKDLPDFEIGGDFGNGLMVFISSLVHMIPAMIVWGIPVAIFQDSDALRTVMMLVALPLFFFVGSILLVGIVRFGMTDESGTLFQFIENSEIVLKNPAKLFFFYFNMVLLSICVFIGTIIGSMLLVIPGLIVAIAGGCFSQPYLYAQLGEELGLAREPMKMKRKVQEY